MDAHRHSISEPALLSNAQVKKRVSSLLRSDVFFLACPCRLEAVTKILTAGFAQRLGDTGREAGDTTPEPASRHLPSDRRDCETQQNKRETPRSRRHSIWHPTTDTPPRSRHLTAQTVRHGETSWRHDPGIPQILGDTGRQAGDTTLEPASQHLASDRRDWETQGDKRETRPRSRRHSIWHLTADRETSGGRHDPPASRHLASKQAENRTPEPASHFPFSIPQVRTPMLCCLGKNEQKKWSSVEYHSDWGAPVEPHRVHARCRRFFILPF